MAASFRHASRSPYLYKIEAARHPMTSDRSSPSDSPEAPLPPGQRYRRATLIRTRSGPPTHPWAGDPPRIAIYADPHSPPVVVLVTDHPPDGAHIPQLVEPFRLEPTPWLGNKAGACP